MIAVLKGVEVVEDKSIGGLEDAGLLAGETTGIPRDQPEAPLAARLGLQTLGCSFLTGDEGQGVESDGVLQEHRPVGGDGEIMQKSEAWKAVGAVVKQRTGVRTFGGELHQPDGAAGPGFDPEGDHAGAAVVTWIKPRMGTEGFTLLKHTIQTRESAGLQALRIKGMGFSGLPEGQQLITQAHHIGVGDVLQPQVEGVGQPPAGLLATEHTAIQHLVRLLLRQPALRAHEAVGELHASVVETHGGDHAVAIEGVMNAMSVTLEATGTVAVKRPAEFHRHRSTNGSERHIGELLLHIDEGTGPVAAVVGAGRSDGHGQAIDTAPSSRNGL